VREGAIAGNASRAGRRRHRHLIAWALRVPALPWAMLRRRARAFFTALRAPYAYLWKNRLSHGPRALLSARTLPDEWRTRRATAAYDLALHLRAYAWRLSRTPPPLSPRLYAISRLLLQPVGRLSSHAGLRNLLATCGTRGLCYCAHYTPHLPSLLRHTRARQNLRGPSRFCRLATPRRKAGRHTTATYACICSVFSSVRFASAGVPAISHTSLRTWAWEGALTLCAPARAVRA